MTISQKQRDLRAAAVQTALASIRLAGLNPSTTFQALLSDWVEGHMCLDSIRGTLSNPVKEEQ